MRTINVNHRDGRGRVEYHIFETVDSLLEEMQDANVALNLESAIEGDYVVSDNGWVVPLIKKTYLEDKYCRGGKKRYKRNKIYRYVVFHFPKDRKVWRANNLHNVKFNYTPKTGKNIASDDKRNRMYELSARKIFWAQLVANGIDMEEAVRIAYPRVVNKNKLLKQLLLNDKLMSFMLDKQGDNMKIALEKNDMNASYFIGILKDIIEDDNSDPKLKVFALQTIKTILTEIKKNSHAYSNN